MTDDTLGTKVLAGGQSLIPAMKHRFISPRRVVDITGLRELDYLRKKGNILEVGALVTTGALENSDTVTSTLPILGAAASTIGDPLVRNMGTVGGNLCLADPVNDLPAVMLALEARMVVASAAEERRIDADKFFIGAFRTRLSPVEVLTGVELPLRGGRCGGSYKKVRKASGGFTIAGVASQVALGDDNSVTRCGLGLTGVGSRPIRASEAEREVLGKTPESWEMDEVADMVVAASNPLSDKRASANYRRRVLRVLTREALEESYENALHKEVSAV